MLLGKRLQWRESGKVERLVIPWGGQVWENDFKNETGHAGIASNLHLLYMLGAKHGFVQSMDCTTFVQSCDCKKCKLHVHGR